jgi:hypothetical protein
MELKELMAGFPDPWWVVGGYAVEAYTHVRRPHEDIDLVVFEESFAALRAQFSGVFHLWSNHGGTFRVIDDEHPEPLHPLAQVWMRQDARSPWRIDCPINASNDGRWVSRHNDAWVFDLEEVTWVARDGVRYLNPDMTLLHKAKRVRPKDDVDLENVLARLPEERRSWLRESIRQTYGDGHVWMHRLSREA